MLAAGVERQLARLDALRDIRRVFPLVQGFAAWIAERTDGPMTSEQAGALAAVGLGSLFSSRLMRDVLSVALDVDDQALVDTWVQTMSAKLERPAYE